MCVCVCVCVGVWVCVCVCVCVCVHVLACPALHLNCVCCTLCVQEIVFANQPEPVVPAKVGVTGLWVYSDVHVLVCACVDVQMCSRIILYSSALVYAPTCMTLPPHVFVRCL